MKLRKVEPIAEGYNRKLARNPIPPPPKIAWLRLDELVIDESYQRDLSFRGRALIRRLVENWDWNCFKPLSVARCEGGGYEIIDGQHTAIAAATHGAIETLPCLVLDAATLAQRSKAFIGINRDRVALTPFALFRARLAAEDPEALAVDMALTSVGATLIESVNNNGDSDGRQGLVACVGTLLQIVRHAGAPRLKRILNVCIAAGISPIPSTIIKGLDEIMAAKACPDETRLVEAIVQLGGEDLVAKARHAVHVGRAVSGAEAVASLVLERAGRAEAA